MFKWGLLPPLLKNDIQKQWLLKTLIMEVLVCICLESMMYFFNSEELKEFPLLVMEMVLVLPSINKFMNTVKNCLWDQWHLQKDEYLQLMIYGDLITNLLKSIMHLFSGDRNLVTDFGCLMKIYGLITLISSKMKLSLSGDQSNINLDSSLQKLLEDTARFNKRILSPSLFNSSIFIPIYSPIIVNNKNVNEHPPITS